MADAGADLLSGQEYANRMTDMSRKTAAYNALRAHYGDVAGDPAAADTLQKTNQAGQEYERAGALRAALALKDVADKGGDVGAFYDSNIAPIADEIGLDPTHVKPLRDALVSAAGSHHLDDLISGLRGYGKPVGAPITLVGDDGVRRSYQRDSTGNLLPIQGGVVSSAVDSGNRVATGQENAGTNRFRATTAATQGEQRLGIEQQRANTAAYGAESQAANRDFAPGAAPPVPGTAPAKGAAPTAAPAATAPTQGTVVSLPAPDFKMPTGLTAKGLDIALARNGEDFNKALNDPSFKNVKDKDGLAVALMSRAEQRANLTDANGAPIIPGKGTAPAAPAAAPARGPQSDDSPYGQMTVKGRLIANGEASTIANQATNLRNTNQIVDQVTRQVNTWTTGMPGVTFKNLPGSMQNNLRANIESLKAKGLNAWIASLKNSKGQTGVGRILQSEVQNAMNLYGNLEQDQTADQFRLHLKQFTDSINQLYAHAHDAFVNDYGHSPEWVQNGGFNQRGGNGGGSPNAGYTPAQQTAMKKYGL